MSRFRNEVEPVIGEYYECCNGDLCRVTGVEPEPSLIPPQMVVKFDAMGHGGNSFPVASSLPLRLWRTLYRNDESEVRPAIEPEVGRSYRGWDGTRSDVTDIRPDPIRDTPMVESRVYFPDGGLKCRSTSDLKLWQGEYVWQIEVPKPIDLSGMPVVGRSYQDVSGNVSEITKVQDRHPAMIEYRLRLADGTVIPRAFYELRWWRMLKLELMPEVEPTPVNPTVSEPLTPVAHRHYFHRNGQVMRVDSINDFTAMVECSYESVETPGMRQILRWHKKLWSELFISEVTRVVLAKHEPPCPRESALALLAAAVDACVAAGCPTQSISRKAEAACHAALAGVAARFPGEDIRTAEVKGKLRRLADELRKVVEVAEGILGGEGELIDFENASHEELVAFIKGKAVKSSES